jgi:thiamine biosynthesis lipoprotein
MRRPESVSFGALGTTAVVSAASHVDRAAAEVRTELAEIDRACSRFRDDSDLSRVNAAPGTWIRISPLLVTAIEVALRAAELTDGMVDPTLGGVMIRLGYDRDFGELPFDGEPVTPSSTWTWTRDWRDVEVRHDSSEVRIPPGVSLDLGSTAKALAADRAASRAAGTVGAPVLVSLGGDVAVAGDAPDGGWPIGIADHHASSPERGETVAIASGGLASSSTTARRWTRGGVTFHHLIDPRTGAPASEVWRTASVCAGTCVDANTASTASIVLGEDALGWLARQELPARLVRRSGVVERVAGWPEAAAA